MDFLDFDDKTVISIATELEFSQNVQDLDDIILSQIPLSELIETDTTNFQSSGNFNLDYEISDVSEDTHLSVKSESLETETLFENVDDNTRWAKPVNEEEINALVNNSKNKNTSKNTKWAFNVFSSWRESRAENVPLLLDMDHEQPNHWLTRFICEARKQNGQPYPSKSVYLIMCGLLRYLRDNNVFGYNILDEKDELFAKLNSVLDSNSKMKQLVETGVDLETKSADPILPEDEDKLWNIGVFGNSSSENLQLTVFYYACKLFGLRGHDEHRSLETGQFNVGRDKRGKWIQFIGKGSKTNKGGLRTMKLEKKNIRHYCNEGPRCVADYFEQYIQAIGDGYFYKRPLQHPNGGVRYGNQSVGVNRIKTFMKTIANKGGLSGYYTNHSGKKTCAQTLYDENVPEQEIMQRTGHASVDAVRKYKRATPQVAERTSAALNPPEAKIPKVETSVECVMKKEQDERKVDYLPHHKTVLSEIANSLPNGGIFNNCTFNF